MARIAIILASFFCISGALMAQEDYDDKGTDTKVIEKQNKRSLKDKFEIGGAFAFQFGNTSNVVIAPTVGYRITPRFVVGAGPNYNFLSAQNIFTGVRESYHIYGARAYTRYLVIPQAYLTAEFEQLAASRKVVFDGNVLNKDSNTLPARLLLGAGYTTNFDKGFGFNMEVLYDVLDSPFSGNLIPGVPLEIRGGVRYGF